MKEQNQHINQEKFYLSFGIYLLPQLHSQIILYFQAQKIYLVFYSMQQKKMEVFGNVSFS